jgi:hypothetical protein
MTLARASKLNVLLITPAFASCFRCHERNPDSSPR